MIIGELNSFNRYRDFHPLFSKAFDFLENTKLNALELGKTEIDGENVFAIISDHQTGMNEAAKLEAHKKYIDIHYIISGTEKYGWKFIEHCTQPENEFNTADDYVLFLDKKEKTFELKKNEFVILFPDDAHAPCMETKDLKKVVLKIKL